MGNTKTIEDTIWLSPFITSDEEKIEWIRLVPRMSDFDLRMLWTILDPNF